MSVTHNWVGAVDDSSAWVRGKITGASGSLFVSTSSDMSGETLAGSASATADGMVSITASTLSANTTYFWQLEDDGDAARGPTGKFRTHGTVGDPFSYEFAAFGDAGLNPDFPGSGSELDPNAVSNHPAFDTVRMHDPLFVAHLGDMHYYNLGGATHAGTVANYRTSYDDVLAQLRQHQLYREVPLVYSWDDHDFDGNNSDGTYASKGNAAQVYRERAPHYPLVESTGPIYHAFQVGRVLHMVADVRYNRSPNDDDQSASKTMLGSAQKSWMDTQLGLSTADVLIWHMPSQWMGTSGDSWNSFQDERDELVTMFGDHGWLGRMCVISADWHGLAVDSGANNAWGGFPVFQFASIDASPGEDKDNFDRGASPGRERYGLVRVDDQGGVIRVRGRGYIGSRAEMTYEWFTEDPVTTLPLLGLDYTAGQVHAPFEPTQDDQQIRNDVTVEREDGSSARWTQDEGPLSTQPPPAGVGRYDQQVTVPAARDGQLADMASWRVHLGTVDEPRYPEVTVSLTRNQELMGDVARVESGDLFTISNPPAWLPPGGIELIALGYSERITLSTWEWTANAAPASPWTVGVVGDDTLGRADTAGSRLLAAIGEADTAFDVVSGVYEGFEDDTTPDMASGTWTRTSSEANNGTWCLRSADITHSETSDAVFDVSGYDQVQFAYRVSSEDGFDFFRFLIDGVEQLSASGLGVWTQSQVFDVSTASQITFRYAKDGSVDGNLDTAFIDDLTFDPAAPWIDSTAFPGEFPFDVEAGGEVMRVTDVSGEAAPQTFTVTRSINGVAKAHAAGAAVSLAHPAVIAL